MGLPDVSFAKFAVGVVTAGVIGFGILYAVETGVLTQPSIPERLAQCGYTVASDVANLGTGLRMSGHGLEAIMQPGEDGRVTPGTPVYLGRAEGQQENMFYPSGSAPAGAVIENAGAAGLCNASSGAPSQQRSR